MSKMLTHHHLKKALKIHLAQGLHFKYFLQGGKALLEFGLGLLGPSLQASLTCPGFTFAE